MIMRPFQQALLAVVLQAFVATAAFAQQPMPGFTNQPAPAAGAAGTAGTPPAQPEVVVPPAQLAAAVEYLMASGATKGFEEDIPKLVNQIRLNHATRRPEIAQVINDSALAVIPEFVKRRDELNKRLAVFYAKRFSEEELKQLTQFYKSPVGVKLAGTQIDIIKESVPEIQKWQQGLAKDADARIREEVKKKGQNL